MARIARISAAGIPYHVTQRGSGRQNVFHSEADYRLYLDLLRANCSKFLLRLRAFCLMPNHVHLIALPTRPNSMARTPGRTHADYARHFNLQHRACGHVWQARFFSCPLDEAHLWRAMAYVERNPVRAGLVGDALLWNWSSARAHCGCPNEWELADADNGVYDTERWMKVLRTSVGEEAPAERIRQATERGRPLGSDQFIECLELQEHRRLRPLPVGRPKRKEAAVLKNGI
jgi:putative transposase